MYEYYSAGCQLSNTFGIYVHAPWCRRRCPYCNFNVYVERNPKFDIWEKNIIRDWNRLADNFYSQAHSVYFGGGTPSLVPIKSIQRIAQQLPITKEAECTIECNPEDVSPSLLDLYLDIGINRISLGIQTLQKKFARKLNRASSTDHNENALTLVSKSRFRSWSVDIMFGLPQQTLNDLQADLSQILQYNPPHISLYGLTFEENTPFFKAKNNGKIVPIKDEVWQAQFEFIMEKLEDRGYVQYEISNFAQPGHRSIHNEQIWRNGFYCGLGPGAHGYLPNQQRTLQPATWAEWLNASGPSFEKINPEQQTIDAILTWIRHADGIDLQKLHEKGFAIERRTLIDLENRDVIEIDVEKQKIYLKRNGYFIADGITRKLVQSLRRLKMGETWEKKIQ